MSVTPTRVPTTREKALQINLDGPPYGTIAEIGAGQEVANWFFRVGAASGSIAKTVSAYDMTVSDSIYGATRQYVSRGRLVHMLEHEYGLMVERLDKKIGDESLFFAYANTVRVRAYGDTKQECHGWMGMRMQTAPHSEPHDIIIHLRLFDTQLNEQQEVVGVVGVNLIHAALYLRNDLRALVESLRDNLNPWRVEVDFLKFTGPDFTSVDNRLCALQLVESGLTPAAFFTAEGEVMQPSEFFYRKPLLLLRGRFDPVTKVHLDMMASARSAMQSCLHPDTPAAVEIMELSMHNLLEGSEKGRGTSPGVDKASFLARADMLQALGENVLVSRLPEFHRLGAFLSRYTKDPVGIVLSRALLEELFEEKWYVGLDGGLLESLGRLFKHELRLYVYPGLDPVTGECRSADQASVAPHLRKLFEHLLDNRYIIPIQPTPGVDLRHSGSDIRAMIAAGDERWKPLVPDVVAAGGWL
ncbi:MAG: TonB-dependent receptor [Verrucomicrobiales bacterium]